MLRDKALSITEKNELFCISHVFSLLEDSAMLLYSQFIFLVMEKEVVEQLHTYNINKVMKPHSIGDQNAQRQLYIGKQDAFYCWRSKPTRGDPPKIFI